MDAKGAVALVTGGASGLGRATAAALADAGARVVVVDLPGSAGAGVAGDLGDRGRFVAADVTDADAVAEAVAQASDWGPLRIAVSCAGILIPRRVLGRQGPHPLEEFSTVVQVNLIGTFNVARLAAAAMVELDPLEAVPSGVDGAPATGWAERGVIVNTASVAAFEGQIGQAAYAASKGGVASLTLPLARDLASRLIRCVAIAPGVFGTRMMDDIPEEARTALAAQVPHPARLGQPEEYAALVRHIVANPMLNGTTIRLDGALRMPPR
jgi:NAD(P)-dependent dehydrogenase (short-subunit alcohol dehydrogenase family)